MDKTNPSAAYSVFSFFNSLITFLKIDSHTEVFEEFRIYGVFFGQFMVGDLTTLIHVPDIYIMFYILENWNVFALSVVITLLKISVHFFSVSFYSNGTVLKYS